MSCVQSSTIFTWKWNPGFGYSLVETQSTDLARK